jgi:hypothetical protein
LSLRLSQRSKIAILLIGVAIVFFLVVAPPLHQDQSYHAFADRRTILGIPNLWDVISNLPFLIIGVIGLLTFRDFPTRLLFLGVFFTAFGSAYYHLAPDNPRLVWDRLPMTVTFMCLFAIAIKQRALVIPLVILGVVSVVWWSLTDNLWLYGLVQFGTMAAIFVIAARTEPRLWPVIIFYSLSKIAEYFDKQIYSVFPLSGHTLKHLLAGIAAWYMFRWIQWSRSLPNSESHPAIAAT